MSGFRTTSAEDLIVHTLAMIAGGRLIFDKAIFPCTPRAWIACDEAYDEVRSRERAGLTPQPAFAKPYASHVFIARSLVLTTKLNCIARKPRSLARTRECSSIRRAMPLPWACDDVMYPPHFTEVHARKD